MRVAISHIGRGSILLVCVAASVRKRSNGYKCTGNRPDAGPEGQPDASAQGERGYGWIEQQVGSANGVEIAKYYGPLRWILAHIGNDGMCVCCRNIDVPSEQVKKGCGNDCFDWQSFVGVATSMTQEKASSTAMSLSTRTTLRP